MLLKNLFRNGCLYIKIFSAYFEKILLGLLATLFVTLLISQVILLAPSQNGDFALASSPEGIPLEKKVFLYGHGKIGLNLVNDDSCLGLKVLVNGEQQATFTSKYVEVALKDGDVVEIDGSEILKDMYVDVAELSGNTRQKVVGKRIRTRADTQFVAKLKFGG